MPSQRSTIGARARAVLRRNGWTRAEIVRNVSTALVASIIGSGVGLLLLAAPADQTSASDAEQATANASSDELRDAAYQKQVRPLLKRYCFECHGADDSMGELRLDRFDDLAAVRNGRKTWERVLGMLSSDAMPPADAESSPTKEERAALVGWIDSALFDIDCSTGRDPGRVTIRRLNRNEYNNTIHDLVGVDFQPADDFPSDDVGSGFDNIGDVLSLPPLLLEKYMSAAEKIAEAAIIVFDPNQPLVQRFRGDDLKTTGSATKTDYGFYKMNSTGSVFAEAQFHQEEEYTFRIEAAADQAGPDPARVELRVGETVLKVFDTKGRRRPRVYETKAVVPAGPKRVSAAFINDYYRPDAEDPKERDRNLAVRYLEVESTSAPTLVDYPPMHRRIIFCRPDEENSPGECAHRIMRRFADRAFRRPIDEGELDRLVNLVETVLEQGEPFERGIQVGVQAVLVSPQFLFRVERDESPDDPLQRHAVADYELASRLSYFLWSSMPDAELFSIAAQGQLHREDVLQQQVRRMLADPRSEALVENFGGQWLNLRNLAELTPDPKQFADFNDQLRSDMRRETELVFGAVMREDRSILDVLDADFTFINERLAKHYGIDGVEGEQFRRVSLEGLPRAGVLTHASILTLTSNPTRTSPVKRGKWIMENILGAAPPPPPPGVPELEETKEAAENASLRERLLVHREDPGCASCHDQMDALGFGFENFDPVGRWRDKDGEFAIDSSGTLPSGETFNGAVELVRILKRRESEIAESVVRKMLTYALGRGLEYYDRCAVDAITTALGENGYRFSVLVNEIAGSEPFRMRRGDEKRE